MERIDKGLRVVIWGLLTRFGVNTVRYGVESEEDSWPWRRRQLMGRWSGDGAEEGAGSCLCWQML